jgi:hypothetical protein
MTASSHGMTFHTHCLSNGLQIVAQPFMCALVHAMSSILPSQVSLIFLSI